MGISSRDYYQKPPHGRGLGLWHIDGMGPVVKYLLIANIAVFLLQVFVTRKPNASDLEQMTKRMPEWAQGHDALADDTADDADSTKAKKAQEKAIERSRQIMLETMGRIPIIQEWLELDTTKVLHGQVWRLITCAFCHDRNSILHIVFNMLILFWFGKTIESMLGSREFLLFYFAAALISSVAFIGLDLYTGSRVPAVGASGAVIAVMMLYTVHFPRTVIICFWFIPLEMRWLMLIYLIYDLHPVLLALSGDQMYSGIGHAAHLGGFAFGYLYGTYDWNLESLVDRAPRIRRPLRNRGGLRLVSEFEEEPVMSKQDADLDLILEKISKTGQASLSEEELTVLRRASEKLKKRR